MKFRFICIKKMCLHGSIGLNTSAVMQNIIFWPLFVGFSEGNWLESRFI